MKASTRFSAGCVSICLVFGDGMESASCGCSGSYVRNEQSQDSDLDVLIEFSETPGLFKFVRLERELSDLVGIEVNLATQGALKPNISRRVLNQIIAVC